MYRNRDGTGKSCAKTGHPSSSFYETYQRFDYKDSFWNEHINNLVRLLINH